MLTAEIPWTTPLSDLLQMASENSDAACCVFSVAETIPQEAREGFVALVMAYTRESEPVTVLDDGSAALLVIEGGVGSANAVARRVQFQLDKLALKPTVRIGISAVTPSGNPVEQARAAAAAANLGEISTFSG